jgi:hypothetical protein
MVASVMDVQIKIGRKCLAAGIHNPGVLETLQTLNDLRKLVESFEATLLAVDID